MQNFQFLALSKKAPKAVVADMQEKMADAEEKLKSVIEKLSSIE